MTVFMRSVHVHMCNTYENTVHVLCMYKHLSNNKDSIIRYWSPIDEMIREAVVLRGVRVRLLISFWKKTHPLTFNFVTSLESLCMHLHNCSLEVVSELNTVISKYVCSLVFTLTHSTKCS